MKRILVFLAVAGLAVAAWFLCLQERLPGFVDWVRAQGLLGAVVLGLGYAAATVLMIPGALVTLAVGYVYGPWWGTALVSPASVLGATLAFLLGRSLLRARIEAKMAGSPRFAAMQRAIAGQGMRILVLLRLSPVFPFVLLNYAFGLTRIPLGKYVLGSFLGMLPGTFLYVYLGSTASDLTQLLSEGAPEAGGATRWLKWGGLAATLVVTVIITRLARKALAEEAPAVAAEGGGSKSAAGKAR